MFLDVFTMVKIEYCIVSGFKEKELMIENGKLIDLYQCRSIVSVF